MKTQIARLIGVIARTFISSIVILHLMPGIARANPPQCDYQIDIEKIALAASQGDEYAKVLLSKLQPNKSSASTRQVRDLNFDEITDLAIQKHVLLKNRTRRSGIQGAPCIECYQKQQSPFSDLYKLFPGFPKETPTAQLVELIKDCPRDASQESIKVFYESRIEKMNGSIQYNKDADNILDFVEKGRLQCYSGTYLHQILLRKLRGSAKFQKNELPVVILTPGHIRSGYLKGKNPVRLFSVEHTQKEATITPVHPPTNAPGQVIVSSDDFLRTEIFKGYIKNTDILRTCLGVTTATARSWIEPKANSVEVSDGQSGKLSTSFLAFGEADVPPGDLSRAQTSDILTYLDLVPQKRKAPRDLSKLSPISDVKFENGRIFVGTVPVSLNFQSGDGKEVRQVRLFLAKVMPRIQKDKIECLEGIRANPTKWGKGVYNAVNGTELYVDFDPNAKNYSEIISQINSRPPCSAINRVKKKIAAIRTVYGKRFGGIDLRSFDDYKKAGEVFDQLAAALSQMQNTDLNRIHLRWLYDADSDCSLRPTKQKGAWPCDVDLCEGLTSEQIRLGLINASKLCSLLK